MAIDSALSGPFEKYAEETAARAGNLISIISPYAVYSDLFLEQTRTSSVQAQAAAAYQHTRQFQSNIRISGGLGIRGFNKAAHVLKKIDGWHPDLWEENARSVSEEIKSKGGVLRPANIQWTGISGERRLENDSIAHVSLEEKKHLLAELIEAAYSYESTLQHCEVAFKDTTQQTLHIDGQQAVAEAKSRFGLRVSVRLVDGAEAYTTRGYTAGFGEAVFDASAVVREVIDRVRQLAIAKTKQSTTILGKMPVVFAGGWAGLWLHETAGHLLEIDVADRYTNSGILPGAKIANTKLTVYDDPTLKNGQGGYLVDDEGVRAQKNILIKDGHLSGFLTDRYYAMQKKMPPTGNGRRTSYADIPLPRMSNLCMGAGIDSPEDLISSVNKGLFVKQVASGVQHRNRDAFEIKVLEGYIIEEGRLTHPVTNLVLAGEVSETLQKIKGIGNDVVMDRGLGVCEKAGQVVPVSVKAPTVLIDNLEVRRL